ncbi:MAG: acyl-CoA thioesterase [Deltaproteobacteria bacterium]|nr:acyl-CoA thioesterase [Deltaproteobacteria bacterium]MBW2418152.1 acyl-CoA thioesterase [Deltaproteobacteria bacterium]
MAQEAPDPPRGARISIVSHKVTFYETDAMGVVHHSNYLRFFEEARTRWLEDHDQPYSEYIAQDLHFAVTEAKASYHRSATFADLLEITVWMEWVRGASLRMAYRIERDGELIVSGYTEHASINSKGRLRRIPKPRRDHLTRATPQ